MLKTTLIGIICFVCLQMSMALHAAVPIEIVGLFKDRAVIRESNGERLLSVGETTRQGVKLVSASSREAVVSYQGERHTVVLSNRVTARFAEVKQQQVTIAADDLGQYRIRGAINNRYVDFLVDTGASVVALSSAHADSLGIDYRRGQLGSVQTAQGNAESYFLQLREVTVAGIKAHNVQAAVITGTSPLESLLGRSFLTQVSSQENAGVMTLVQNV